MSEVEVFLRTQGPSYRGCLAPPTTFLLAKLECTFLTNSTVMVWVVETGHINPFAIGSSSSCLRNRCLM